MSTSRAASRLPGLAAVTVTRVSVSLIWASSGSSDCFFSMRAMKSRTAARSTTVRTGRSRSTFLPLILRQPRSMKEPSRPAA